MLTHALPGRIYRRNTRRTKRRDTKKLPDHRHGVRGELASTRAGARTSMVFQIAKLRVRHFSAGMSAYCFKHILNRHIAILETSGSNRSAVNHEPWNIQSGQSHDCSGNGLV